MSCASGRPSAPGTVAAGCARGADAPLGDGRSEPVAELGEGRPPRVGLRLAVLVRLQVEILAADAAESGAVRAAEDLVGKRQDQRVAGPRREVEAVLREVRRD